MRNENNGNEETEHIGGAISRPTLELDVALYQHYLDDSDMTEPEKIEFIQAMYSLVLEFVMMGFEIHPLQKISETTCGKHSINGGNPTLLSPAMLKSEGMELTDNFKQVTTPKTAADMEGVKA